MTRLLTLSTTILMMAGQDALAAVPVELPPTTDPAAWDDALGQSRLLVPDLEFGFAVGDGPTIRLLALPGGWALDVVTKEGRCPLLTVPDPTTPESRAEILLVATDQVARGVCGREPEKAPPPEPPGLPLGDGRPATWATLRIGADLLADALPTFSIGAGVKPTGSTGIGPSLSWIPPRIVWDDGVRLGGARLALGGWWMPGDRTIRPILGLSPGVSLYWLTGTGNDPQRTFTPTVRADAGLTLNIPRSNSEGGQQHGLWSLGIGASAGTDFSRLLIQTDTDTSEILGRWSMILWFDLRRTSSGPT